MSGPTIDNEQLSTLKNELKIFIREELKVALASSPPQPVPVALPNEVSHFSLESFPHLP
jgi:fructose-1-phosphate kinase PfkB-like protein